MTSESSASGRNMFLAVRLVVHLDLFTDLAGNMASAGQSHGLQEELVFRVAPAEAGVFPRCQVGL